MNEPKCPACGGWQHYRLNDSRLQCVLCRKKYTVGTHRSKLPLEMLHVIAQGFWRMIPASAAAAQQGMNSKTLQKYYDLLRRTITAANERYAVEQFGTMSVGPALFHDAAARKAMGADMQSLFCLARGREKVVLLNARDEPGGECAGVSAAQILGWVYAQDRKALALLDLDRMHFLPASEAGNGANAFWPSAKRGMVRYHGGFRKNFYFFVREMEFRFNNQHEDSAVALLTEILQNERNR